jgi:hypothetical protein|tara:strand:+ start:231 stop:398 length:168 start_codon:yes stop_codon:yes gene_type:complete
MQQPTANKKTKFYDNPDVDLKAKELVKPIASLWFMAGNMISINAKPTNAISGNLS